MSKQKLGGTLAAVALTGAFLQVPIRHAIHDTTEQIQRSIAEHTCENDPHRNPLVLCDQTWNPDHPTYP